MELKLFQHKIDGFIALKDDIIINDIMIFQPFRYEISNNYCRFLRGNEPIAMIHIMAVRDIY